MPVETDEPGPACVRVAKSSSFRYADHATFLKTISFENWNANRKTNEAATKKFKQTGFIVFGNNHRKSKCWEPKQPSGTCASVDVGSASCSQNQSEAI